MHTNRMISALILQILQELRHIFRQICCKFHKFTFDRVGETKGRGMQRLPGKSARGGYACCAHSLFRQFLPPAINRIADQAVPAMGHVHANLMGPASFQPAFHQRCDSRRAQCFH